MDLKQEITDLNLEFFLFIQDMSRRDPDEAVKLFNLSKSHVLMFSTLSYDELVLLSQSSILLCAPFITEHDLENMLASYSPVRKY